MAEKFPAPPEIVIESVENDAFDSSADTGKDDDNGWSSLADPASTSTDSSSTGQSSNLQVPETDKKDSVPKPADTEVTVNMSAKVQDTPASGKVMFTKLTLDVPPSPGDNGVKNGPGSPGLRRHHSRESVREEELRHLTEQDLVLATTLIQDAEKGRNFTYKTAPVYVRFYIFYHKWYFRWTLYFFILLNMALALIEKPTREGWEQPFWVPMVLELMCLVFFIGRVVHSLYFSVPSVFWRDTKNIMVVGIIALTLLDILCYIIWINADPDGHAIRWSRPLRSLLIINFSDGRQIRRAFRNIRRTVPEIMNVLVLFLMSILLFALLALKLFSRRTVTYPTGRPYFKNYFDSIWDLYVLVTTANNPDVMMPAYDESKWFALFFIIYVIICLYIFMSIVLAAIYNNYRNNLKNEIKMAVFGKRRKLRQAFEILKVEKNGEDVITLTVWRTIMARVLPGKSQNQIDLMMTILDLDSTGYITKPQLMNLVNLMTVPLSEVKDRQTLVEQLFPAMYNARYSQILRIVVRHKFFRIFFDFMIFVNAWFIGFDVDEADWFFLSLFMLEIVLKLYTFGPKEFFIRFWNAFDFFVIGAAVVATAVEGVVGAGGEELNTLDLLLVLRVMRLIKIFGSIKRFKVILMTIINIGPSILTYGGVIFVAYYMFAIVGMEVFHGLIRYYGYNEADSSLKFCGTPALNGSIFYRSHYCNNNFNDILRSFVVLFELTVVNQWHVLTSGFVFVTSKAARLYFFTFHLCCVVIVLNIFVAFILEAFILEYSIQKTGKIESAVESKIKELGLGIGQTPKLTVTKNPQGDEIDLVSSEQEMGRSTPPVGGAKSEEDEESDTDSIPDLSNEKGLRFHLKKKSRKKVETLLQQMFEGEINSDDEVEEEAFVYRQRQRKPTLDMVT